MFDISKEAAATIVLLAGLGVLAIASLIFLPITKDNQSMANAAQQDKVMYYTSEVVKLDMDSNEVVLDNGTRLNVMRGWHQALVPDIGDIVSYGETIKYYPNSYSTGIHTENEIIHIDKEVIGSSHDD